MRFDSEKYLLNTELSQKITKASGLCIVYEIEINKPAVN